MPSQSATQRQVRRPGLNLLMMAIKETFVVDVQPNRYNPETGQTIYLNQVTVTGPPEVSLPQTPKPRFVVVTLPTNAGQATLRLYPYDEAEVADCLDEVTNGLPDLYTRVCDGRWKSSTPGPRKKSTGKMQLQLTAKALEVFEWIKQLDVKRTGIRQLKTLVVEKFPRTGWAAWPLLLKRHLIYYEGKRIFVRHDAIVTPLEKNSRPLVSGQSESEFTDETEH